MPHLSLAVGNGACPCSPILGIESREEVEELGWYGSSSSAVPFRAAEPKPPSLCTAGAFQDEVELKIELVTRPSTTGSSSSSRALEPMTSPVLKPLRLVVDARADGLCIGAGSVEGARAGEGLPIAPIGPMPLSKG